MEVTEVWSAIETKQLPSCSAMEENTTTDADVGVIPHLQNSLLLNPLF